MSNFLKYIIGNSVFIALISNTSITSLDIYDSLNIVEYSNDAIKIYDFEILDGIFCEEITFVNTADGFNISFSSQNDKYFEEAEYYFDSKNNTDFSRKMDEVYREHKNKRKFQDKMDDYDVRISVRKIKTSSYALLMFRKII